MNFKFIYIYWGLGILALFLLLNNSCNLHKSQNTVIVQPAFYYWKQTFALNAKDQQFLSNLGVQKLYVKVFDVIFEKKQPTPVATLQFQTPIPLNLQWVPVVFITNQTFEKISLADTDSLAQKVAQKINAVVALSGNPNELEEIQIDCDWTQQTRHQYFHFLAQLRQHFPTHLTLSATIRLHQVKYQQKTGIPPADKGLLMYYNMGNLRTWDTQNSILDNHDGAQYIDKNSSYPLPLEVGLPIFSWGLLFREKKFNGIFNGLHPNMADTLTYLQKLSDSRYKVALDTIYGQTRLKKGDRLRIEAISPKDLLKAADVCRHLTSSVDTLQVIVFHYDTLFTNRFTNDEWGNIFESFR